MHPGTIGADGRLLSEGGWEIEILDHLFAASNWWGDHGVLLLCPDGRKENF